MAARSLQELQKRYASLGKVPKGGPGGGPRGRGPRPKGKPKDSRATVRRLMGYIGAHWFRLIFVFLCNEKMKFLHDLLLLLREKIKIIIFVKKD